MTACAYEGEARIGPNAITRLIDALRDLEPQARVTALLAGAGLSHYLTEPPHDMVAEDEVVALNRAVRDGVGAERGATIQWLAGWTTGEYLLANRIPRPVQKLMRFLPQRLAARVLLAAIRRNAWTFAGSGDVKTRGGARPEIVITNSKVCGPDAAGGAYYAGTFERLFRELVSADARAYERRSARDGGGTSVFEIKYKARPLQAGRA